MSAPLIVPAVATPDADGVTQTVYRRLLADELGMLAILQVTTTPSIATTPDAARQVICEGFQADGRPEGDLDGRWLYVVDGVEAGEVRQVLSGTYDGPWGSLLVDKPFSAPLASGTQVELTDTLPARRYGMVAGLRDVLNLALAELNVVDVLQVDAVSEQLRYTFVGYPWPVRSVVDVFEPRADTDKPRYRLSGWSYEQDASIPQLVLPSAYETGQTFEVAVHRPADTWIKHNGVWASSSVGLADEADCGAYDEITVCMQALPIAKRRMARMYPLGSKEREELKGEADQDAWSRTLSKFFGKQRGSGAVRVGARGGRVRGVR